MGLILGVRFHNPLALTQFERGRQYTTIVASHCDVNGFYIALTSRKTTTQRLSQKIFFRMSAELKHQRQKYA